MTMTFAILAVVMLAAAAAGALFDSGAPVAAFWLAVAFAVAAAVARRRQSS